MAVASLAVRFLRHNISQIGCRIFHRKRLDTITALEHSRIRVKSHQVDLKEAAQRQEVEGGS